MVSGWREARDAPSLSEVFRSIAVTAGGTPFRRFMAFVGPDFVITVRHGEHTGLRDVRRRLEADPEQLALGPGAVLHAVADHVVDKYLDVTEAIEDDIDEMEREARDDPGAGILDTVVNGR